MGYQPFNSLSRANQPVQVLVFFGLPHCLVSFVLGTFWFSHKRTGSQSAGGWGTTYAESYSQLPRQFWALFGHLAMGGNGKNMDNHQTHMGPIGCDSTIGKTHIQWAMRGSLGTHHITVGHDFGKHVIVDMCWTDQHPIVLTENILSIVSLCNISQHYTSHPLKWCLTPQEGRNITEGGLHFLVHVRSWVMFPVPFGANHHLKSFKPVGHAFRAPKRESFSA